MAINHVFVYGTLLSGMDNFHLVESYAAAVTPGADGLPAGYRRQLLQELERHQG